MVKKRFYPSQKGGENMQKTCINFSKIIENTQKNGKKLINLESPVRFSDSIVKRHDEWAQKFADSWINPRADIGTGYSITQYNTYIENRLSYAECAFLANDTIISNAIAKYANEILRKGGRISINNPSDEFANELIKSIETRLKELNFWHLLHKAIKTSLIYGGAVLFLDFNSDDLTREMLYNERVLSKNKLQGIRAVEPYLVGANNVNSTNPLNDDYMQPSEWYISGGGSVHKSRIITLSIFECPDMIKPLYNYLGISLCQFMRDYVASADISRQGLADIFTRFKTMIIETPALVANEATAIARAKLVATQRNNQKIILLTPEEKYIETITTTAGLDKLIAQMQENIAVSARMPAVKLLGLTPSGFNATGDFDLKSYYDEIMSLQNSIIKPIIERILHIICLELGYNESPSYEFERLDSESALNEAQINATEANTINSLIASGIITQEQGFEYLRQKEILPKSAKFESENADLDSDLDLGDLDLGGDEPQSDLQNPQEPNFSDSFADAGFNHYEGMSNNAVDALNMGIKPISYINPKDCRVIETTLKLPYKSITTQQLRDFAKQYGDTGEWHHITTSQGTYDKVSFYDLGSALENADLKTINKAFNVNLKDYNGEKISKQFSHNFYNRNELDFVKKDAKAKEIKELKARYKKQIKTEPKDPKKEFANMNYSAYISAKDPITDIKERAKENINRADLALYKQLLDNGLEIEAQNILKRIEHNNKKIDSAKLTETGDNLYRFEPDSFKEPQGTGEWLEKDHPRNPDGSFKSK